MTYDSSHGAIKIDELDFGELDAESDRRLSSYFVTTPHVQYLTRGRRTILLGRKGSGKSALFTQLPRLAHELDSNVIVSLVTPNQYAWSSLRSYREQGLSGQQAAANAWKFTLIVEAVAALVSADGAWSETAKKSIDVLRKFLSDNFGTIESGFLKSASAIVGGLRSLNLSAFGFGVGFESEKRDQIVTPAVLDALIDLLQTVVRSRGVILALDRVDEVWDGSESAKDIMIGLLMASKELNNRLQGDDFRSGLRVDVFLRSDIYDVLRFDEKDKLRALEEWIEWDSASLLEMVNKRLPRGVSIDEILDGEPMRGGIMPFDYIVKRTYLRPREVIQFLSEAQRRAGRGASVITKDAIREAEQKYSVWKVEDLKQEFAKVFPDFDRLLEAFRQGVHRYDSEADVEALLQDKVPDLVEVYGARPLVERLFEYSVLGVRVANQGSAKFKAEDSDLMLPANGSFYVHQSLMRGLGITEARKS